MAAPRRAADRRRIVNGNYLRTRCDHETGHPSSPDDMRIAETEIPA